MLKLKLQHFGHLMWRTDSFEKTLILGKIEGRRRRGQQRMRWLDGINDSVDMIWVNSRSWWWTGKPGMLQSMLSQRVRLGWATELNWLGHMGYLWKFISIWQRLSRSWPICWYCYVMKSFIHWEEALAIWSERFLQI